MLRMIQELTDRLMHATGKTWTPPPSYVAETPEEPSIEAFLDYGPERVNSG